MTAKGSLERDIVLGQEAGKATDMLARQYQGCYQPMKLEVLKETVQDRKKWRMLVEEKTRNRECTNVNGTQKATANHQ